MKSLFTGIRKFFWPEDSSVRLRRAELTFWAFILALAYLPLPFGFIAWFALARPIAIISKLDGKSAFKAAYFYAFMSNLFQLYWVAVVTPPGMVAAIFILSLYPALILYIFNKIYHSRQVWGILSLPVLWVGMEFFRSLTEAAFPWTDLAYSQGYYLTFIQIASVISSYGLSLIVIVLNILVWLVFSRDRKLETKASSTIAFLAIIISVYAYGWVVLPPYLIDGDIRVSLLQGNVDLETKWQPETRDRNFQLYDSLASVAADTSADLIIWPETAAPSYPRHEPRYRIMLSSIAKRSRAPNLIGALDVVYSGDERKSYNAAFQFSADGQIDGVYHKIKLVPFSERSPYQEQIPFLTRDFLQKYVTAIQTHEVQWWSNFYSGDSIVLFEADTNRYSILICFEAAFPDYVRQGVLKGASFIVNITNDTWFGRSPGPFQHMRIAVMRAIENRIWLARCANSGISAVIDPYGRERVRAGLYKLDILTYDIYPISKYSVFTKSGPVVGKVCWWITALILLAAGISGLVRFTGRILVRARNKSHN